STIFSSSTCLPCWRGERSPLASRREPLVRRLRTTLKGDRGTPRASRGSCYLQDDEIAFGGRMVEKQPIVRGEWMIAMAIIFVALMALVFTFCATSGTG